MQRKWRCDWPGNVYANEMEMSQVSKCKQAVHTYANEVGMQMIHNAYANAHVMRCKQTRYAYVPVMHMQIQLKSK